MPGSPEILLGTDTCSGDEDVDYTAPKTPSYSPSTDIEEHMDKQNDAYEDKTSRDPAFTTSAFPSFYSSHIPAHFQAFTTQSHATQF